MSVIDTLCEESERNQGNIENLLSRVAALEAAVASLCNAQQAKHEIKPECLTECQYQHDHNCHSWSRCNDRTTA